MSENGLLSEGTDKKVVASQSLFSPFSPIETTSGVENLPTRYVTTPRRKLSMSVDDTPPRSGDDNGYGDSINDSNFFKSSMCSTPASDHTAQPPYVDRSPLSVISTNGGCVRKTLPPKRSIMVKPSSEKENVCPKESTESFKFTHPNPSHRPASLPSLPSLKAFQDLPQAGNIYRQISSPLGRMSLMSPTSAGGSRQSSRPSSITSILESDGYFSDQVFDGEEMEGPVISRALSSLISAPASSFDPTPMTSRFSEKGEVIRPTPLRPVSDPGNNLETRQKRGSLKRSGPGDLDVVHHKKRCPPPPPPFKDSPPSDAKHSTITHSTTTQGHILFRSQSCCDSGATPLSPGLGEESFIGDKSKPYALPLVKGGTTSDLKCISPDTLCDVINGKFSDTIDSYSILDCRFPYEYEGGHIQGAVNIWTQEALLELLFSETLQHPQEGGHRKVFILHCEFSSKRGPKMSRFLRGHDRKENGMAFPKLFYPELYLLEGGYKAFFEQHSEACDPCGYCCMEDENHKDELRICKARSKSFNGGGETQVRRSSRHHRHSAVSQDSKLIKHTD